MTSRMLSFQLGALRLPALAVAVSLGVSGCFPDVEGIKKERDEAAKKREEKEKAGSIIRKTTQDIGKYDPEAGRDVSDGKIRATSMVLYPLEAYGPMVEQIAKLQIDQLVLAYNIENDRFPTYEEFMRDIVKKYNVQLPVLPGKAQYQYDEKNHQLVVVAPEKPPEGEADGEPKEGDAKTDVAKPDGK